MFRNKVNLSEYSNYKIGGPAESFHIAKNIEQIMNVLDKWRLLVPHKNFCEGIFILGGGTNLLIDDNGFSGLVLKPEITTIKRELAWNERGQTRILITVGAGVSITQLLNYSIANKLSGLEWAGGLPGTVGGAIRGNAGAFGGEIKDSIKEVVSLDISKRKPIVKKRNNKQCFFGYRDSVFKQLNGKEIILEAKFAFKEGNKKDIQTAIGEKVKYRETKQPLDYPNIGSIFKNVPVARIVADLNADITRINKDTIRVNPRRNQRVSAFNASVKVDPFPVVPAAHLIHEAELKGVSYGGAMISPKHPNFIVNVLNARASDVKNLIKLVKASVKNKFGVELEEEIQYVE